MPKCAPTQRPSQARQKRGQRRAPSGPRSDCGDLDHQLHPQRARREPVALLEQLEQAHQRRGLLGDGDLGQRDDEVVGQPPPGRAEQRVDEELERARAPRASTLRRTT